MKKSITFSDLESIDAEMLIWMATAISDEGREDANIYSRYILAAFDYLLCALTGNRQWDHSMEYTEIEGLKQRLREALDLIEASAAPPSDSPYLT